MGIYDFFHFILGDVAILDFYLWTGDSQQNGIPSEVTDAGYTNVACLSGYFSPSYNSMFFILNISLYERGDFCIYDGICVNE